MTPTIIEHPSPNHSQRKAWSHGMGVPASVRVDTVLIHHTASASNEGAASWLCMPQGAIYYVRNPVTGRREARRHDNPASAHYLVETTGRILRLVPEHLKAWHAGLGRLPWETCRPYDFNHRSVGVEVVNPGDGVTPFTEEQYRALAWLVPDIVRRLPGGAVHVRPLTLAEVMPCRTGVTYILGHRDVAPRRKTDPAENFEWGRIRDALTGGAA